MTVDILLATLLGNICPRVSPDFADLGTARPYVTYQQIGGRALAFLDRSLPSKENAEIQINVWANTRIEAVTLMKQIEEALAVTPVFQAEAVGARRNGADPDTRVYGSRQDFSIWCDR